ENVLNPGNVSGLGVAWTATTGGQIGSSPAVKDGVVYVGSNEDHKLYAFRARNGAVLWSAMTGGSVLSSPAVASGVVYVGSWDDHMLFVLDETSDELCWSANTGVL